MEFQGLRPHLKRFERFTTASWPPLPPSTGKEVGYPMYSCFRTYSSTIVDSHGFMNAPRRLTDVNKGSPTVTSPMGNTFNFKSNTIGPTSAEFSVATSAPLSLGP